MRPKTYCYSTDDSDENKKSKGTKKHVIKRKLKFEDHKYCLKATQLENKTNQQKKVDLMWKVLKKIIKMFKKTIK